MLHFANTTRVSKNQVPDHNDDNSYTLRRTRPRPMSVVQSTYATDRFTSTFVQRPSTAPFTFTPKAPTRFCTTGFQADKCATLSRVESIRRRTGAYKDYLNQEQKKLTDKYYDMLARRPGCDCISELMDQEYTVKSVVHYRHEIVPTQNARRPLTGQGYTLGREYPSGASYRVCQ